MSRRYYHPDDDLPPRDRPHKTGRRHVDHHYAGKPIITIKAPGHDRKRDRPGRDDRASRRGHRPLPPALAPLASLATPAEVDAAYRGECPRGRSHVLHILHVGGQWRLFCTKGCREGDILKAIGRPPDVLRKPAPAEPRARAIQYSYFDLAGALLFVVSRRPNVVQGKHRFHVQPHAGIRPGTVYRLAELMRAPTDEPVFWVEGEKDVETLRANGLVAVTTSHGASSYDAGQAKHFRGRTVVILPDNDPPGQSYADRVANSLRGVAAKVDIIRLPGLPPKGDVSDWLANGGRVEDLLKAAEVPDFFKPVKTAPPPPKADPTKTPLGTVEAAILAALASAEHKSLTTDALPMLVAGLAGEVSWNARAMEPIIRYPNVLKVELAKARASISRALGSLARRGLIEKTGRWVRLARTAPSRR